MMTLLKRLGSVSPPTGSCRRCAQACGYASSNAKQKRENPVQITTCAPCDAMVLRHLVRPWSTCATLLLAPLYYLRYFTTCATFATLLLALLYYFTTLLLALLYYLHTLRCHGLAVDVRLHIELLQPRVPGESARKREREKERARARLSCSHKQGALSGQRAQNACARLQTRVHTPGHPGPDYALQVLAVQVQCQRRPTTVSKETYYSVKRDLLQCRMHQTPLL